MQVKITVDGIPHKKVGEALTQLLVTEVQTINYWSKRSHELLNKDLNKGVNLQEILDEVSRIYLMKAAMRCDNKQQIADMLGLGTYQTVSNRAKKLGMDLNLELNGTVK